MPKQKDALLALFKLDSLRYISIKTQVRRLRYFSVILNILQDKGSRKDLIQQGIVQWSANNHDAFESLTSSTGEIQLAGKTKKSQSFENYFDAARKLGLIDQQNEFIIPSRIGAVYKASIKDLHQFAELSGYRLNNFEKVFFLWLILKNDSDYFLTVIEMIFSGSFEAQESIITNFQVMYLKRLESKVNQLSGQEKLFAVDTLNRVKGWRSPKRYCEDIVPPRVNWLIELGLVDTTNLIESKKIKLGIEGVSFYTFIQSNNLQFLDITNQWLDTYFVECSARIITTDTIAHVRKWSELEDREKDAIIIDMLSAAYKHFSVLGLPRISLEQSLLFCSLMGFFSKNIIIEAKDIFEWIGFERKIGNRRIGIRHSARIYESYIIIDNV